MSKTFDIKTLSQLARIELTPAEAEQLALDLKNILAYVEKLAEIDTSAIEPTSHVLNIENVFRDDVAIDSGTAADVLAVLPGSCKQGQFFKVPKIIEEG